jgi:segregation and condensation protein A
MLSQEDFNRHADEIKAKAVRENAYQYKRNDFDGPLELLIMLIHREEINLYDIPIAEITDQYLNYLQFAADIDLASLVEFQVMAAELLYIKSRMLLPDPPVGEDWEDPRAGLVEQLIEYQKYKKLSELMEEKERENEWMLERKSIQRNLPFPDEPILQKVDVWDLLQTFSKLMSNFNNEIVRDLFEEVSVNEKFTLIMELLETKGEFNFWDLIVHPNSIIDVVCSFLALLESVKQRTISIYQNVIFGDIIIKKWAEEKITYAEDGVLNGNG